MSTLAACTTLTQRPAPPSDVTPAPAETPAQVSIPPSAQPDSTQPNAADNSPTARAARLAGRPPVPDRVREPPPRLVGLTRELVLDLLGKAGFVRHDGPVQIWRYTSEDCFLDVFLFREGDGFRVKHVEARSRTGEPASFGTCYQRLVEARRAGRTG